MAVSVTLSDGASVIVYQTPTGVSFDELDASLAPVQVAVVVSSGATSWINAQALADGGFTVEWTAQGVLTAQDFDAAGTATDQPHAASGPVKLAPLAFSSNADGGTAVLPLPIGGYVTGLYPPAPLGEIQHYNALGAPDAPAVQTGTILGLKPMKFAPLADGSYVAEIVDDEHAGVIFLDHLSAAGAVLSTTDVYATGIFGAFVGGYSVAGLADGGYVLAWTAQETANGAPLNTTGVFVRAYAASGQPEGSAQMVGTDAQLNDTPLIEALPDGRYVVAWTGTSGPQDQVFTEADPALGVQNAPAPIPPPRNGFSGDGRSDLLIENTSNGAVVLGEVGPGGLAVYSQVGGLGPEWMFVGSGDFPAVGFLIENANSGAVELGTVQDGQAHYDQVAALGPEWSFAGVGDFLGEGRDQVLIRNTSGSVVVGDLKGGQASWTQVASLGPEWTFVGAGDFLGDGKADFLIENTAGSVLAGEVGADGQANWTQVASLGPEWKFAGVGDFLGDGRTDFLMENANNGAVVAGEVGAGGQASWTQVASLGPEWTSVGAGDVLGEGRDQFLIEHTSGLVVAGDVRNGQAVYSQVGALGPEWRFRG